MEKKKVWVFGDSYADPRPWYGTPGSHEWPFVTWTTKLSQVYNVRNLAMCGTGFWWSMDQLNKQLKIHDHYSQPTEDTIVIFFVSDYVNRPMFNFLESCDSVLTRGFIIRHEKRFEENFKQWFENVKKVKSRYKKYADFISDFFDYSSEYQEVDRQNINYVSHYTLLKELSNKFNKMLLIPLFSSPHELIGKIENTDKFMIAEGYPYLEKVDDKRIDMNFPNHMRKQNHDIMFNMLVDWIENNTVFDTRKLIKVS